MPRRVREAVEARTGKVGMEKTEGERSKRGSRKKMGGKGKTVEVKRIVEKWEIWNEEKKAVRSETEVKKLVPEKFHK